MLPYQWKTSRLPESWLHIKIAKEENGARAAEHGRELVWKKHFCKRCTNLAKSIGVVNVQSVMPYVGFDEQSYLERMKHASMKDKK